MNDSVWFDHLDGDSLACKPGHEEVGYEIICRFIHPAIGYAHILCSLGYLRLLLLERRKTNTIVPTTQYGKDVQHTRKSPQNATSKTEKRAYLSYSQRMYLVLWIHQFQGGLLWLIHGMGTKYGGNHISGQIGDFVCKETQAYV
jgi:hypothetical protein